jgi:hypothetical protein
MPISACPSGRRCSFTRAFRPLAGYEPRDTDTYRALLATLIAHGTNLGLTAMGSSVERLTAADLQHASRWLVREATLKAANAQIIEYQHRLSFAAIWGDGRLSSSDGQRFAADSDEGGHRFQSDRGHRSNLMAAR